MEIKFCPKCGHKLAPATTINKQDSINWYECTNNYCNTLINSWQPQPHQEVFLKDPHEIKGNFGGYGTGKTSTSEQQLLRDCLTDGTPTSSPNAALHLVGANIQRQYEQTFMREIFSDWPVRLTESYSVQKQTLRLINGSSIIFQPFDDIDKIRSYNLSSAIILEASECKPDVFTQIKTRLRNTSSPYRSIIVESNPDPGWIKYDLLDSASQIHYAPSKQSIPDAPEVILAKADPFISAHITTTYANRYLPPNFVSMNTKNKPAWWVAKYILGSFTHASGQVYVSYNHSLKSKENQDLINHLAQQLNSPRDQQSPTFQRLKRIITVDYGLRDDTAFLYHALFPDLDIIIAYKEEVINDQNPTALAEIYWSNLNFPQTSLLRPPLLDGKSLGKRDYDKKTLSTHFEELGVFFEPAQMDRPARVASLTRLLEADNKFKRPFYNIASNYCPTYLAQLQTLKYPEVRGNEMVIRPLPEDKEDHVVCAGEFFAMEIPFDKTIDEIVNMNYNIGKKEEKENVILRYNPLSDNPKFDSYGDSGFNSGFEF